MITEPKKRDLVIIRVFDAPVEQVWKAWSDRRICVILAVRLVRLFCTIRKRRMALSCQREDRYVRLPQRNGGLTSECSTERNPMRAGRVEHPAQYRCSSYRANMQGDYDSLRRPHFV